MDAYKQMNAAAQKGSINSDDFDIHLQQLSARYNISILVLDEDSETIRVSGGDPSILKIELWNHVLLTVWIVAAAAYRTGPARIRDRSTVKIQLPIRLWCVMKVLSI